MATETSEEEAPPQRLRREPRRSLLSLLVQTAQGSSCGSRAHTHARGPRAASLGRLGHGPATAPRVRCGGSRWEKRMRLPVGRGSTAVLAWSGSPMAASRVGYVNMEVVDARTLHTSGVAAVDWLVSVWAVSILGLCGEMPHRSGSCPCTARFGGGHTAELAPLGTGSMDGLVIAGPTVGSTNVCELFNSMVDEVAGVGSVCVCRIQKNARVREQVFRIGKLSSRSAKSSSGHGN